MPGPALRTHPHGPELTRIQRCILQNMRRRCARRMLRALCPEWLRRYHAPEEETDVAFPQE